MLRAGPGEDLVAMRPCVALRVKVRRVLALSKAGEEKEGFLPDR